LIFDSSILFVMLRMGKRMKRAPDTWTAKNAEKARNETDPIIKSGEVQVYTRQGALPARDNKLK
jgi:hypothetical protein